MTIYMAVFSEPGYISYWVLSLSRGHCHPSHFFPFCLIDLIILVVERMWNTAQHLVFALWLMSKTICNVYLTSWLVIKQYLYHLNPPFPLSVTLSPESCDKVTTAGSVMTCFNIFIILIHEHYFTKCHQQDLLQVFSVDLISTISCMMNNSDNRLDTGIHIHLMSPCSLQAWTVLLLNLLQGLQAAGLRIRGVWRSKNLVK